MIESRWLRATALLTLLCGLLVAAPSDAEPVQSSKLVDFYGFIKFESFYDNVQVAQGDWLLFVPEGSSSAHDEQVFSMNARGSRFGFNLSAPEKVNDVMVTAKLEADFAGGFPNSSTAARQPNLRLRHAWLQLAKGSLALRMGQDWALISGPFPNTASFVVGAGKGNLWMRYPQLRLTWDAEPLKVAVSANRPMAGNVKYNEFAGGDFDMVGDGELTGLPWGMGRAWLSAGPATFSISGHGGIEAIPDLNGVRHDKVSWSVNGDIVLKAGPLALTARAFMGENLNSFFGGVFQGYVAYANDVGNVASLGGWAQAVYSFNEQWALTVGGGMDDPDDEDLLSGARASNTWAWGNIAYKPAEPVRFLLETEYVQTDYVDREAGDVIRVMFVSYYTF